MRTYRLEITLEEEGLLQLKALPFHKGETVEVIVLERPLGSADPPAHHLKGSVQRYDEPTEPVAPDDWEAAR